MDEMKYIEDSSIEKFIKASNQLKQMDNSINIDYAKYISIYTAASKTILPIIAKLSLKKFIFLHEQFPNFDFDFEGRLKAEYSFFDKILRQALEKNITSDKCNSPETQQLYYALYDIFAFRIILNSISYDVDNAICVYNKKKHIYEYQFTSSDQEDTHTIKPQDVITFSDGKSVVITSDNLTFMHNRVYLISENGSYLPINGSKITKRDRTTLDSALYSIKDKLSLFYKDNGYKHISDRDKDYVNNPKGLKYQIKDSKDKPITNLKNIISSENSENAINRIKRYNKTSNRKDVQSSKGPFLPCYQSLHQTYYYEPYDIYFEDQIRTIHMHNIAEYDSHFGHDAYKSNRLDENSLSKLPTFITYSREIVDGIPQYSYKIHDMEYSVEKSFGISLEDFIQAMNNLDRKKILDSDAEKDHEI